MEYIVLNRGYINGRIYEAGETFNADDAPESTWYEPADGEKAKKPKKPKKAKANSPVKPISEIGDAEQKQARLDALQAAYESLDPTNDDDWTKKGLVDLNALNSKHEGDDFSRGDVPDTMNREALLEQLTNG